MPGLGLLILRLVLAAVFVAHGGHTLFGLWAGPGIGPGGVHETASFLATSGMPHALIMAVVTGGVELAGGLLLGIGWQARWASATLALDVVAGLVHFHWQYGFFLNYAGVANRGHGIEYGFVVAGALLCLLLAGAGEWSIDGRRANSAARAQAARARLRGKIS